VFEFEIIATCSGLYLDSWTPEEGETIKTWQLELRNQKPNGKFDRYLTLAIDKDAAKELNLQSTAQDYIDKEVGVKCRLSQWQGLRVKVIGLSL